MPTFEQLKDDYASCWASMEIRPEWAARARQGAERILSSRAPYESVEAATGVPWHIIGVLHQMECGGSFKGHLHNGDPLTARTVQVPKGRPTTGKPTFTWDESAVDALKFDGLDKVTDWGPERIAWCLEKYNGFGSRDKGVPSAYLWSGSNQYTCGKYVRDGVWSATAVSQQAGGMVLLKALLAVAPEFAAGETLPEAAAEFPKAEKEVPPPAQAEIHAEVHAQLQEESWMYWANRWNLKSLSGAAAAVGIFLKDNPVYVVAAIVAAITLFELMQFDQRQKKIRK